MRDFFFSLFTCSSDSERLKKLVRTRFLLPDLNIISAPHWSPQNNPWIIIRSCDNHAHSPTRNHISPPPAAEARPYIPDRFLRRSRHLYANEMILISLLMLSFRMFQAYAQLSFSAFTCKTDSCLNLTVTGQLRRMLVRLITGFSISDWYEL